MKSEWWDYLRWFFWWAMGWIYNKRNTHGKIKGKGSMSSRRNINATWIHNTLRFALKIQLVIRVFMVFAECSLTKKNNIWMNFRWTVYHIESHFFNLQTKKYQQTVHQSHLNSIFSFFHHCCSNATGSGWSGQREVFLRIISGAYFTPIHFPYQITFIFTFTTLWQVAAGAYRRPRVLPPKHSAPGGRGVGTQQRIFASLLVQQPLSLHYLCNIT